MPEPGLADNEMTGEIKNENTESVMNFTQWVHTLSVLGKQVSKKIISWGWALPHRPISLQCPCRLLHIPAFRAEKKISWVST